MLQVNGQERLVLTQYAMLKEVGAEVYPAAFRLEGGCCVVINTRTMVILDKQASMMRFFEWYRVFLGRTIGAVRIPRHAGSIATIVFIGAIASYGAVLSGQSVQSLQIAGSLMGLGVDKVEIHGNQRVSDIDVFQALKLEDRASLPILDINQAQSDLAALPWVEKVSVRKVYPDKIIVSLTEKTPFAVCQRDGVVSIIDNEGRVIVPYNAVDAKDLPFFVGQGSAKLAKQFLAGMDRFPKLKNEVQAYIRVANRRWDILLNNGVRIKLPENKPFERLSQAEAIDQKEGLFDRDIKVLDLRLDDRITVALGDDSYSRYMQAVAAAKRLEQVMKSANIKSGGRV